MSKNEKPLGIRVGFEIRNNPGSRPATTTSITKPPKK